MPNNILDLPDDVPQITRWGRFKAAITQERLNLVAILVGLSVVIMATLEDSSLFWGILIVEFILIPIALYIVAAILCAPFYWWIKNFKKRALFLATALYILGNLILLFGASIDYWSW